MVPISLILKHGREIANDIDNPENQPILASHLKFSKHSLIRDEKTKRADTIHRHITAFSITRHRVRSRSGGKQLMHLRGRANEWGSSVDCEYECEDDGEEDSCVCASDIN
jgi:hypothetical protein